MKNIIVALFISVILGSSFATALKNDTVDRPDYHFTASSGWINDPNGLVQLNDTYHMFYQYYGGGWGWKDGHFASPIESGPKHWGHATSTDLVHWTHLPVALSPDERVGDGDVRGMIFSGSVVRDTKNSSGFGNLENPPLVAIYTLADTFGVGSGQRQALAYSLDQGLTWTKYAGNPVLPYNGMDAFRDPQVFWHDATSKWIMALSCGDSVCFFNSPDLKQWTPGGSFGKAESGIGVPWECPDLFPLHVSRDGRTETKWVLIVSVQHGAPSGSFGTRYFIGDFDGVTFQNSSPADDVKWLDHGNDYYATKSWLPADGNLDRRILVAWMANWTYAQTMPATHYRGSMTTPREVSLAFDGSEYYLAQQPAKTVRDFLAHDMSVIEVDKTQPEQSLTIPRSGAIRAKFDLSAPLDRPLELSVTEPGYRTAAIRYDTKSQRLLLDRSNAGGFQFDERDPMSASVSPIKGEIVLDIYVDRGSIEIFANDGRVTLTSLLNPMMIKPKLD